MACNSQKTIYYIYRPQEIAQAFWSFWKSQIRERESERERKAGKRGERESERERRTGKKRSPLSFSLLFSSLLFSPSLPLSLSASPSVFLSLCLSLPLSFSPSLPLSLSLTLSHSLSLCPSLTLSLSLSLSPSLSLSHSHSLSLSLPLLLPSLSLSLSSSPLSPCLSSSLPLREKRQFEKQRKEKTQKRNITEEI